MVLQQNVDMVLVLLMGPMDQLHLETLEDTLPQLRLGMKKFHLFQLRILVTVECKIHLQVAAFYTLLLVEDGWAWGNLGLLGQMDFLFLPHQLLPLLIVGQQNVVAIVHSSICSQLGMLSCYLLVDCQSFGCDEKWTMPFVLLEKMLNRV